MKKWKKCLCSIVALLLLISLTACGTDPSGTTVATNPSGATAATDPIASTAPYITVEKPAQLPTGGWQNVNSITPDPYALTSDGCYFTFNSCLCFLDTNSGYSAFLCSRPTCRHGEFSTANQLLKCDAYLSGSASMLFCQNNTLYSGVIDPYGTQLYARDIDGTNMRQIATLGKNYISKETTHNIGGWSVCGEYLYYQAYVDTFDVSGENFTQVGKTICVLSRLNLNDGREEELLRTDEELFLLQGVNDGLVLLYMWENFDVNEFENSSEYIKQVQPKLRLWSEEAGGVATLCELDNDKHGRTLGITEGQLHFRSLEGGEISAYDFTIGELSESKLPPDVTMLWNQSYAGVYRDSYYNLASGESFENAYGNMELPEGFDKFYLQFLCVSDDGIVFSEGYYKKQENNRLEGYDLFSYVPFSKMDDGLQLSDRMIFMRYDDSGWELIQPEG